MKVNIEKIVHRETVKSAIKVSLVVGILLNFINQGVEICTLDVEHINWWKLGLTFTVPFIVSIYSAIQTKKMIQQNDDEN